MGQHFKIKYDHFSLKYLLKKIITTPVQQKWQTKLLGYDFEIAYRSGQENKVADALSRKFEDQVLALAITFQVPDWVEQLKHEW